MWRGFAFVLRATFDVLKRMLGLTRLHDHLLAVLPGKIQDVWVYVCPLKRQWQGLPTPIRDSEWYICRLWLIDEYALDPLLALGRHYPPYEMLAFESPHLPRFPSIVVALDLCFDDLLFWIQLSRQEPILDLFGCSPPTLGLYLAEKSVLLISRLPVEVPLFLDDSEDSCSLSKRVLSIRCAADILKGK